MAMDFPISPSLNQTYTFSSKTWKWDGSVWKQQIQDAVSLGIGGPVTFNATTISTNQTFTNGSNGFSVGPITIGSNATVTVTNNQRWVIL
jgi:hypothetical protein